VKEGRLHPEPAFSFALQTLGEPVMSDSEAIPAATLIVMREALAGPPELLMVERPRTMSFAAGAMVFPGGRIEAEDHLCSSDLLEAARRAAVRETEEETGLEVPLDAVVPFARWRPDFVRHKRFDTFFFLAPCPPDAGELRPQPGECERAEWLSAAEVLRQLQQGIVSAIFPTVRNLERLALFDTFAAARDHAAATPIETITPWIEEVDGERWLTIPSHLGYPVTRERVETALRA
jgi:8-oxo-dGTP pyrophosphatase MutT (NUDIX family)